MFVEAHPVGENSVSAQAPLWTLGVLTRYLILFPLRHAQRLRKKSMFQSGTCVCAAISEPGGPGLTRYLILFPLRHAQCFLRAQPPMI